ncbi:hypothetical protein [Leptospira andrefontaineae]|uniref:Uncharacterized protein n=1 Tax=Leptospira andrefontaineae TaxID=2484976 RepID=A0A4R9H4E7_9LEPT|nr:hypothetical protein [Leptospira andrefontaineae]TGK39735.1 hypothetical protein EHO65_11060 [Leptospira andrefontaineae]
MATLFKFPRLDLGARKKSKAQKRLMRRVSRSEHSFRGRKNMFYLLLQSVYQDYITGRSDRETYINSVIRLALDQEKLAGLV